LEGSKYKTGDLVSCYYKTIPPTPQWDPFVEGRPAIITRIKTSIGSNQKQLRYFYEVAVTTFTGALVTKMVSEENLLPYAKLPDLDKEIDELVMNYYKKHPHATD